MRGSGWSANHPMLAFLARRSARLLLSLALLLVLSFAMIHLIPGDPVRAALGPRAPQSRVLALRHDLGLEKPLATQFVDYVGHVFTGNLGTSFISNLPVSEIIGERLPNTARLAGIAFVVILGLSLPIGMLAAILTRDGRRRGTDLAFTTITGGLAMMPEFLLGVGLVYVFAVSLKWFPVAGQSGLSSYVLPVTSLCLGSIAALARIVRAETLKVLGEDYMRTARSKRLPARLEYLRHCLPNMLTATLTLGGLLLGGLIGGTVLVENVFAWPGLGTIVTQSVAQQDYALAQAIILLLGGAVLIINFGVDVLLGALDRRSTIREA
jgi:ABC-type dipeptide/oligopeptide/nickel transport system permease component